MGTMESVGDGMLPSIVDPRDYERLRFMQMNGGTGNSFEETIHRLKVQEVLKKRERFHKEHEEILRDIRQGLLQIGREGGRTGLTSDDTYMYDDDARCAGMGQHWYDEPPYESDPEDFLMGSGGQPVPTATIQNGRVCFTLNLRPEPRGAGVISLRSAGDISLPREAGAPGPHRAWLAPRGSARRGLLLPQSGPYPATIIPLGESGDYAGSDVQSVGSRLSTMSIDTSRSEQMEGASTLPSPSYVYPSVGRKTHHPSHKMVGYTVGTSERPVKRSSSSDPHWKLVVQPLSNGGPIMSWSPILLKNNGLEETNSIESKHRPEKQRVKSHSSTSPSSDYEDQEEGEHHSQQLATVHASDDGVKVTAEVATAPGRIRGLQKKAARTKMSGDATGERKGDSAFPSASSLESLPSGSGSSTQALVPADSNHSSLSAEDRDSSPLTPQGAVVPGGIIGKARALVDYIPSPYDKDALRFKKGEVIDILAMNPSGLWKGSLHGRVGTFKFINVEVMGTRRSGRDRLREKFSARGRPQSVEELLQRINLEEHISVFVLNGYEDLELFKDLEEEDLDYLGIANPEHRAKILTAVDLLHDYDSPDSPENTDGESPATSSDEAGTPDRKLAGGGPAQPVLQRDGKQLPLRLIHFPRELELSARERLQPHHRHRRLLMQGTVPHQHHHHHHHHTKRSSPTGNCDGPRRETPNNLGCDVASLQQRLPGDDSGRSLDPGANPQVGRNAQQRLESPHEQQHFHPNIPATSSPVHHPASPSGETRTSSSPLRTPVDFKSDSYVVARGKLVAIESCRKNVGPPGSPVGSLRCGRLQQQVSLESPSSRRSPSSGFASLPPNAEAERSTGSPVIEDSCETNPKLTMVKFVVGGSTDLGLGCESGNVGVVGGKGGCFSEKSSDSGVSSSSLSSANPRENSIRKEGRGGYVASTVSAMESPTRGFQGFGPIVNSRASAAVATGKPQGHKFQSSEKNSYQ